MSQLRLQEIAEYARRGARARYVTEPPSMTKFYNPASSRAVPKITLVVEKHKDAHWLMLQPAEGEPTKLAKFRNEEAAREFWRAYNAHAMSMHALGALGI